MVWTCSTDLLMYMVIHSVWLSALSFDDGYHICLLQPRIEVLHIFVNRLETTLVRCSMRSFGGQAIAANQVVSAGPLASPVVRQENLTRISPCTDLLH